MANHALLEGDGPSLRHRWFDPRTMEPRLRVLTAIVLAQIFVAAVMLVLREADICRLFGPADACSLPFIDMRIQLPNYAVAYVSFLAALGLFIVGLMEAEVRGALLFFGVLLGIYVVGIFGFFTDPFDKLALVLTVFMWAGLVGVLPKAHARAYRPERRHTWVIWLLLAVGLAPLAIGLAVSAEVFGLVIILLRIPLAYLFVLAGTDWAEIDDAFLRWSMERFGLANRPRAMFAGAVIAAGAVTGVAAILTGYPLIYRLPGAVIAAGVLLAVLRSAGFRGQWPVDFPWAALAFVVVAFNLTHEVFLVNFVAPFSPVGPFFVWPAAGIGALVLGVVAGVAMVRVGREANLEWLAPSLLFGLVLALTYAVQVLPFAFDTADMAPPYTSLFFVLGAASLGGLAWLFPRRDDAETHEPVRLIFLLNVGLIGLYLLITAVYTSIRGAGESGPLVAAAVVIVALLWDLFTSGHSITNVDGPWFSRRSRVFLFFGFMMMSVTLVLFWGSLYGDSAEGTEVAKAYMDSEALVQAGIAQLGPAFLLTLFVLRFGRWWATRARAVPSAAPLTAGAAES